MPQETAHARISPSKIARILGCPASLTRCEDPRLPPDRPNPAAEEGTARHEEIATYLDGLIADQDWEAFSLDNSGPDYFERNTTEAFHLLVKVLHTEAELCGSMALSFKGEPPKPVLFSLIHAFSVESRVMADEERDIHGTADVWFLTKSALTNRFHLHVCDFKFGYTPVDAERNAQLMTYAKGVLEELRREHILPTSGIDSVSLHILQPTFGDVKSWSTTVEAIDNWWADIAAPGIDQAFALIPGARPTVSNCTWCRGKLFCPEYRAFADAVAQQVFAAAGQIESDTITDDDLFEVYGNIPMLDNYTSLVKSRVRHILSNGPSHGLKMVRTSGKRAWVPDSEADVLAILDTVEGQEIDAFKTTLVTAPALLKKYPFLKKNKELMAFIEKGPGKTLKIVSEDHPAPAVTDNPFAGLEDALDDEEAEE